ncbi:MAG: hypothetical protein IPJ41_16920 [Phycisphaerales bacterium]|nr:hypothetical protein [Phycisphaerales bacterium]
MGLPSANLVLFFLSAFVGLWGLSVLARGVWMHRAGGGRTCPACGADMGTTAGRRCGACAFEAATEAALRVRARDWRVLAVGGAGAFLGVALLPVAIWVRNWEGGGVVAGPVMHPLGALFLGFGCFGFVLIGWGLRGDRSRGRRRCPRCWYDMRSTLHEARGASLRCPECGHAPRGERDLYRTRRFSRAVRLGAAFIAMGLGGQAVPRALRAGPIGLVPTTVLIAGMGWLPAAWYPPSPGAASRSTLADRLGDVEAWHWQESWAAARARRVASAPGSLERWDGALAVLDDAGPDNVLAALRGCVRLAIGGGFDRDEAELAGVWSRCSRFIHLPGRSLEPGAGGEFRERLVASAERLIGMIDAERPTRSAIALRLLACLERPPTSAVEPVYRYVRSHPRDRGIEGGALLAQIAEYDDSAVDRLLEVSRAEDRGVRLTAISLLGGVLASRPDLRSVEDRLFEAAMEEPGDRDAGFAAVLLLARSADPGAVLERLSKAPGLRRAVRARLVGTVLAGDAPASERAAFVVPAFEIDLDDAGREADWGRAHDSIRRAASNSPDRVPHLIEALRLVHDGVGGLARVEVDRVLDELAAAAPAPETPAIVEPGG